MKMDSLWWVITGRCHLKCQHCYIEAPIKKYHQLSLAECLEVIAQAKEAGIKKIFLTGGEPFIRNDLVKIIDQIYKSGMRVSGIETNACLIEKNIISQIEDKKIVWHVSHDGKYYHNQIRKVEGSEEKSFNAIKLLTSIGFKVSINSVLTQENSSCLLNSYPLLKDIYISSWQIFPLTPIGLAKEKNILMISPKEESEFYHKLITAWSTDQKPFRLSLGGVFNSDDKEGKKERKGEVICDYFKSTVTLMPDGKLVPCCRYIACNKIMKKMKNIFSCSIKEQINHSELSVIKQIKRADLFDQPFNQSCKNCPWNNTCQLGCRVNAYLETKSILHKEQRQCNLMKIFNSKKAC